MSSQQNIVFEITDPADVHGALTRDLKCLRARRRAQYEVLCNLQDKLLEENNARNAAFYPETRLEEEVSDNLDRLEEVLNHINKVLLHLNTTSKFTIYEK